MSRISPKSTGHKLQLAQKNGRAGAFARAAKLRQVFNGEPMKLAMLRSHDTQRAVYGNLFANLPIPANKERQRRACQAAGRAGGIASAKAKRAKRDARLLEQGAQ